jgi:adenine-specific DNA-methyltransferase
MTELIWAGKYDQDGRRVAPLRIALPFQTVETVNESAQQRQRALDLFSDGRDSEWRNRLIWGDKKYVLPALLQDFASKVDLIYIDPPFATGADFTFQVHINGEDFVKPPSVIEQKAYRDTWGRGFDSYLQWFYETALLLRDLLADTGSVYVHCDWRVNSLVRLVMDEVFGSDNFVNQVVWAYEDVGGRATNYFKRKSDTIVFFQKTQERKFNVIRKGVSTHLPGRRGSQRVRLTAG